MNTMNELYARPQPVEDAALSSGQLRDLDEIRSAYAQVRAPVCKDSAAALDELCGHRTYNVQGGTPAQRDAHLSSAT